MNKIDVYHFCMLMHKEKEIILYVWKKKEDDSGCSCERITFTEKFDSRLFEYREYHVDQFTVNKKGCIEIIASNF